MDKYIIGYVVEYSDTSLRSYAKIVEVNIPEGQNTLKLFTPETKNEVRRLYHLFKTNTRNDLIKKGVENAK